MRRTVVTVALGFLLGNAAPTAGQPSPESSQKAYGAALAANDWAGVARLMHPSALRQIREFAELLVSVPEGREQAGKFFGVDSTGSLTATPDTVLFANFLSNTLKEQDLADALKSSTMTPLGTVARGTDTSLVVSLISFQIEELVISQYEVIPWILDKGQWWALLKADFSNMISMIRRAIQGS